MSLPQPERRLRLARAVPAARVAVVIGDAEGSVDAESLVLLPPGCRAATPSRSGGRRVAVQMVIPGLAVRYMARLLEQAAASGWDLDCMASFAAELERRCSYLVACGGPLALHSPLMKPRRRRPRAALWHAGAWMVDGGPSVLAARLVTGARVRDDVLLAYRSGGGGARGAERIAALLEREGVAVREAAVPTAGGIGSPWTIEVLSAPRLTLDHLGALRERFGGAPRCEWCALPVIGSRCHRCAAGALL